MVSAERRKIDKGPLAASTVRVWLCEAGRPDGANTGILQRLFNSPADGWELEPADSGERKAGAAA